MNDEEGGEEEERKKDLVQFAVAGYFEDEDDEKVEHFLRSNRQFLDELTSFYNSRREVANSTFRTTRIININVVVVESVTM